MGLDGAVPEGTGTLTVTVPGAVEKAYLLWQGKDIGSDEVEDDIVDDVVSLAVDGGVPTVVTSSITHSHIEQNAVHRHYYSYLTEVTDLIQQGEHAYTFSDFDMLSEEFGFGLFIVYNTGGLQEFHVQVLEGMDRFWRNEPDHVHGEVHCVDIDPKSVAREMELDIIAAGIGADRDNQIYYQTGLPGEPKPDNLNPETGATTGMLLGVQPLGQYDGPDWDSYENSNALTVPANHGWVCVQVTANEGTADGESASGMIQLGAFMVPVTGPTAVSLQSFSADSVSAPQLAALVGALLLVVFGAGLLLYRRRQF
jgi:hypothetical protein